MKSILKYSGLFFNISFLCALGYFTLANGNYLEPAENENIVYALGLKYGASTIDDFIVDYGFLPIYPEFYHRINAALHSDILISGRFLSLISLFVYLVFFFLLVNKYLNKPILLIIINILGLGSAFQILYFSINRVDGLFAATGLVGLISLILIADRNDKPFIFMVMSVLSIAACILTKQSFILFIPAWILALSFLKSKDIVIVLIGIVALLSTYTAYFGTLWIDASLIGLDIYSEKFSFDSLVTNVYYLIITGCFLTVSIAFYLSIKTKCFTSSKIALLSLIGFSALYIKQIGNLGAIHNNFFVLNAFALIAIVIIYPQATLSKKSSAYVSISILTVMLWYQFPTYHLYQIINNSDCTFHLKDLKYHMTNRAITSRMDAVLINNNIHVEYEASVLNHFYTTQPTLRLTGIYRELTGQSDIAEKLKQKFDSIANSIKNAEYDFILLGSGGTDFIEMYDLSKYKIANTVQCRQGNSYINSRTYIHR